MGDTNYRAGGAASAYQMYGLHKVAVALPKGRILASIKDLLTPGKKFRQHAGEFAWGSPKKFLGEVTSGKALGKDSLIRQSFHAPGFLNKALFYGWPAFSVGGVVGDDEGDKIKRIGSELGGAALGMAAFKPLGLIGALGGSTIGSSIGEGVGGGIQNMVGR